MNMTTTPPQFADFEILISAASAPGHYPIQVIESPAGQAQGTLALDLEALRATLSSLETGPTDEAFFTGLGRTLFNALLPDALGDLYRASLGHTRGAGKRLRLRLRADPPELAALPWEYLYDPSADLFIGISPETVLSRYVQVNEPLPPPLAVAPPLRVLVVLSAPSNLNEYGLEPLQDTREVDLVRQALQNKPVQLEVLEHAVAAPLRQKLREFKPHIVHFIGHGTFSSGQGWLLLEDDSHKARLVSDRQFREFFLNADETRLILLNACLGAAQSSAQALSGLAPQLVRRGLPAVVAMQASIPDPAAITFASEFYQWVADGWSVDAATAQGRRAIYLDFGSGNPAWGMPVIFMRAPDGVLFAAPQVAAQAQPAQPGIVIGAFGQQVGNVQVNASGATVAGGNITTTAAGPLAGFASPTELREFIIKRFSREELRTLCTDLNVDYDSLPGEGHAAKARELVLYMQRHDRLDELAAAVRQLRQ